MIDPAIDYANLPDANLGILANEHGTTSIRLAAQAELDRRKQVRDDAARADAERRHREQVEAYRAGQSKTLWEQLSARVNVIGMVFSLIIGGIGSWAAVKALQPAAPTQAVCPEPATTSNTKAPGK